MAIMDWAAWCVIAGLSFLSIGGLLLWAYGDSMNPEKADEDHQEDPAYGTPAGTNKNMNDKLTSGDAAAVSQLQKLVAPKVPDEVAPDKMNEAALEEAKKREEESFKKAEDALREAIKQSPEMASLEENLLIDSTPEGLRIQIVDKNGYSLFSTGNANLVGRSRDLVMTVGKVISRLPNKITISGNTDSTPYRGISRSNNWELSSGRAFSSMMALIAGGFTEDRVMDIRGKADREPLMKEDTKNPQNRRISIVLLRRYGNEKQETQPDAAKKQDAEAAPPDTNGGPAIHPAADFTNKMPEEKPAASPALTPGNVPRLTPPSPIH